MPSRPEFTVIAGPNGAGKSRLSPYYIHGTSFDGDLLAINLRRDHPDWPDRWISGSVAGELEKQKIAALAAHKDFAFETNFSSDLIIEMIDEFREAGYKISLFYCGLLEPNESKYRVTQREQFGGHDVPNEVIEYNFTEGIQRVRQSLNLFDNITFIDGDSDYGTIAPSTSNPPTSMRLSTATSPGSTHTSHLPSPLSTNDRPLKYLPHLECQSRNTVCTFAFLRIY